MNPMMSTRMTPPAEATMLVMIASLVSEAESTSRTLSSVKSPGLIVGVQNLESATTVNAAIGSTVDRNA